MKYAYLNPVSLNTYRAVLGERAGAASQILDEMERRFGNNDGVKEFVKKWRNEKERTGKG